MKSSSLFVAFSRLCLPSNARSIDIPTAHDKLFDVTYRGVYEQGVETFLSIPYGQDTGGENRFKPPNLYTPPRGSFFQADSPGPACPQPHGAYAFPLYLSNITAISEDCLHLNVYRPIGTCAGDSLPVMVYIHGGSFFIGGKDELVIQPGGLTHRSIEMDHPVIVGNINYRLGGKQNCSLQAPH